MGELQDPAMLGSGVPKALTEHAKFLDDALNPYETARVISPIPGPDGREISYFVVKDKKSGKVVEEFRDKNAAQRAAAEMELRNAREGGLTADEVVRVTQGHNKLLAGERQLFENFVPGSQQNIAAYLKDSFLSNLKASGNPEFKAQVEQLRQMYAMHMAQREELRTHALGSLFGDKANFNDVDALYDSLFKLSPEAMTAMRGWLERFDVNMLDELKAVAIERAMQKSVDPAMAASLSSIDPVRFANALAGKGKGVEGTYGQGLFTPVEQREIKAAATAVRAIRETYQQVFSRNVVESTADAAINIIARTPEFFARFMVRAAGTSQSLERLLLDSSARKALIKLAEEGPSTRAGQAAIAYLAIVTGENEQQLKMKAQEEQASRDATAIGR
jgi:hypothetical protein